MYLKKTAAMVALATLLAGSVTGISAAPAIAACGDIKVKTNYRKGGIWGSGSVTNSCPGWTQYCVTLWWQGVAGYPVPSPVQTPRQQRCASLKTGVFSGSSTPREPCYAGLYYSTITVVSGTRAVASKATNNYDYSVCQ